MSSDELEELSYKKLSNLLRECPDDDVPVSLVDRTRGAVHCRMAFRRKQLQYLRWAAVASVFLVVSAASLLSYLRLRPSESAHVAINSPASSPLVRHFSNRKKDNDRVVDAIGPQIRRLPSPRSTTSRVDQDYFTTSTVPKSIQKRSTASLVVTPGDSIYAMSLDVSMAHHDHRFMYHVITSARLAESHRRVTEPDGGQDSRLNAKISLNIRGRPLQEVLEDVSRRMNISLMPDASVRDQKVVLFLHDLSLRELMVQLQKLFDFDWVREKGEGGEWQYVLIRSARSKALADAARPSIIARGYQLAENKLKRIVEALDTMDIDKAEDIGIPDLAEAVRKQAKGEYPKSGADVPVQPRDKQGEHVHHASLAKAAWLLLTREAVPAILTGRGWTTSFGDLSPQQQAWFFLTFSKSECIAEKPESHMVGITLNGVEYGQPWLSVRTTCEFCDRGSVRMQLELPQHTATREQLAIKVKRLQKEDARYSDPELQRSINLPARTMDLLDLQELVRSNTGFNLICDFYYARLAGETTTPRSDSAIYGTGRDGYWGPYPPLPSFALPATLSFAELLAFLDQVKVDWTLDKTGKVLRLKDRLWMLDDQFEPPQKFVDQFIENLTKNQGWDLNDLNVLAELPAAQLYGLQMAIGRKYNIDWVVNAIHGLLRFHGKLTGSLRQRCWSKDGIGPNDILEPDARNEFYQLILKFKPGLPLDEMEHVRFRIEKSVCRDKHDDQAFVSELRKKGKLSYYSVIGNDDEFIKDGATEFDRLRLILEFRKVEPHEYYVWFMSLPPKGLYPKAAKP